MKNIKRIALLLIVTFVSSMILDACTSPKSSVDARIKQQNKTKRKRGETTCPRKKC